MPATERSLPVSVSAMSAVLLPVVAGILLAPALAHAQAAGSTLRAGGASATLVLETDTSTGTAGDSASLAPDLHVGVTDDLTVSVVHSTFARTGFRGGAGAGVCGGDACANTYDNVGLEALYALLRGRLHLAANLGVHAWSLDRGHHVAKVGAKLRTKVGDVVLASLPAVTIALSHRDDVMAPNRDRLWLPVTASYPLTAALTGGVGSGFKAPLDDVGGAYEVAAGVFSTYTVSPALLLGGSWIHGKLLGGDAVIASDRHGYDYRALHLWVSATY